MENAYIYFISSILYTILSLRRPNFQNRVRDLSPKKTLSQASLNHVRFELRLATWVEIATTTIRGIVKDDFIPQRLQIASPNHGYIVLTKCYG